MFLAIVASTAVLAIAASSGVLFLSTLDTASLKAQADASCPEASMPAFSADVPRDIAAQSRTAGLAAMTEAGSLRTPYSVEIGYATVQRVPLNLYSREGALDHVEKLRSAGGPGVWIPDNFVQQLNVEPGGTLTTTAGDTIRVAGIYRSLFPSPFQLAALPPYWCSWKDIIIRRLTESGTGPLVISDEPTLAAVSDSAVQLSIYDPIPHDSIPVARAQQANRSAVAAAALFFKRIDKATPPDFGAVAAGSPANLDKLIGIARRSQHGVSGSIAPIDLAAVLVALLLTAGAGAFWATHRAREIRLLVARGVGPAALATKALLETVPAAVVGLGVGFAVSSVLVPAVSPASVFAPHALVRGLYAAMAAGVAGLVLIAVLAALSSRDRSVGGRHSRLRLLPWELVLVALAVDLAVRIHGEQAITVTNTVVTVSAELVLFPLIGATAVLLLIGRVVAIALPLVRRRFSGGGVATYLALRRVAGSRAVVVGLIVCTALPGGLLTYTSTLTRSVKHEIAAKYQTNLGAPHVLDVVGARNDDVDLGGQGTAVAIYQGNPRLPGDTQAYVLGVDPTTFSTFAFTDSSQRAAVAKLSTPRADGSWPVILVNAPRGQDASTLTIKSSKLTLHVTSRRSVFPGLRTGAFSMVVINRAALRTIDPQADRVNQVWTTDAHEVAARNVIDRAKYNVLDELTPSVVVNGTGLLPITWLFSYLRALAVMIGLVAVAGLVFALAARTRQRTVSYVMSRRMGLSRSAHLRSLLIELFAVVGLGWISGAAVGAGAFKVILHAVDIYPSLPPPAAFTAPVQTWLVTGGCWVVVVIVAAVAVQALADRAKPAEILRLE